MFIESVKLFMKPVDLVAERRTPVVQQISKMLTCVDLDITDNTSILASLGTLAVQLPYVESADLCRPEGKHF